MCYATYADSLKSVCVVLGMPSQSHASGTPHSRAPAPSEPPPNHLPRPEWAKWCCDRRNHPLCPRTLLLWRPGDAGMSPDRPCASRCLARPQKLSALPVSRLLHTCHMSPNEKRVLCMVAHACVGGDDTRDGYGLVWGMMGDDRVPMRTFCRRARRRNVELVGQFTSFSTRDPAIHERLGCGWGYWWRGHAGTPDGCPPPFSALVR